MVCIQESLWYCQPLPVPFVANQAKNTNSVWSGFTTPFLLLLSLSPHPTMSDRYSPAQTRQRPSTHRFADDYVDTELPPTRPLRIRNANDVDNSFAVATGVNHPVSRSSSARSATFSAPSMQRQLSEMDISSVYSDYADLPSSGDATVSSKQTRDATLNDGTSRQNVNRGNPGSNGRSSFGSPSEKHPASRMALPNLDYNATYDPRRIQGYPEQVDHNHTSFLGPFKHAVSRVTNHPHDPSSSQRRAFSRNSSYNTSNDRYFGGSDKLDNFERSQAINDEVEETYLIDDGVQRGRHPQERASVSRQQSDITEKNGPQDGFQTYRSRRRKEKHVIKYHAECMYTLSNIDRVCPLINAQLPRTIKSLSWYSLRHSWLLVPPRTESRPSLIPLPKYSNWKPSFNIPQEQSRFRSETRN